MRVFALVPLLAVSVAADYASDLVGNLTSLGLKSLAGALTNISTTDGGKELIAQLSASGTNYTFFAPNEAGFAGAFANATTMHGDPGLTNTLAYHVVAGNLQNYTATFPNTTIGRTFLNATNLVYLEGNKSQVVAWATLNGSTMVLNQNTPVKVVNTTMWNNLAINIVDAVLDPPGNLSNAIASQNLTTLSSILTTLPGPTGGSLLKYLDTEARGYTLFAPSNDALAKAMGNATIAQMLASPATLMAVLGNHIVNGSSLYSSELYMNATTASGQYIMATDNHTLTVGQSLVQVVTPDVILQNGVVHVINGVFLDMNTNAAVASSAYVSATSAAGTAPKTTETAPIGNTATMSQTGSGASSSSSSGSGSGGKNGAVSFGISPFALAASLVGVLAGGLMTLA